MKFPLALMSGMVVCCAAMPVAAQPLGTVFTYQGELKVSGVPATGLHDLRFRLYDAAAGGSPVGPELCSNNTSLTGGRFTVDLDFGAVFTGQQRFLEVEVRADTGLDCTNTTGYTTLTPRQPLTAAPNALFAVNTATAATATNATQLNGQGPSFYQNAGNLSNGTIPDARLAGTYSGLLSLNNAGNVFTGSGAGLTALNANTLASGTLADARLSGNVAMLNSVQSFTGAKTFTTAPSFTAGGGPFSVSSSTLITNLNADRLDGLDSTAFLQSIPNPLALSGTSPNHVVRAENASTVTDASAFHGLMTAGTGITYGGWFENASTQGYGVIGIESATSGFTSGLYARSYSADGQGVFGENFAGTGAAYGVFGRSFSTSGVGVFGYAAAGGVTYGVYGQCVSAGGSGVYGLASAGSGATAGGRFDCNSSGGIGVYGHATSGNGTTYGGKFVNDSVDGAGVYGLGRTSGVTGLADDTSGDNVNGVFGQSASTTGAGVYGVNSSNTSEPNYGVRGYSGSPFGRGVSGFAPVGTGAYGVIGNGSGYGVYAVGDSGASGTKSFRIDHPFDPEHKYLLHYSSESPVPQNFYVGNVVTDAKGFAWIELPDYFQEINANFKYQLTVVDGPSSGVDDFVQVKVRQRIVGNRFQIRTSAPNVEVSWRVDADRNDLYVRHKQPKDVTAKEGPERDHYQHPELYGQPPEKGMNYDATQRLEPVAAASR